jgi:hypothetical protein
MWQGTVNDPAMLLVHNCLIKPHAMKIRGGVKVSTSRIITSSHRKVSGWLNAQVALPPVTPGQDVVWDLYIQG